MRPPLTYPQGWAEMRHLLCRTACAGQRPCAAAVLRASVRIAAQRVSRIQREQALGRQRTAARPAMLSGA